MTAMRVLKSARTTPICLHLLGSNSDNAKAAIWQLPPPNPAKAKFVSRWGRLHHVSIYLGTYPFLL
jgi:hypothetical protein